TVEDSRPDDLAVEGPARRFWLEAADAGGGQREIDREGRPAILPRAFGTRDAAVEFDDVPHDGEPESEAMSTADRRLLLPEAVEHEGEEVRSNPLASIAHRDSRQRVGPLQPDVHPAPRWRELEGIGQEVPDDLLESIGIGRDRAEVAGSSSLARFASSSLRRDSSRARTTIS